MYDANVKYVIQGPECEKQGIHPICAKFHIFAKIIKSSVFWKEQVSFLSILAQIPIYMYIGKTTCTFYAICQHKMELLILYNHKNIFMAAILKKTCHHI